MKNIIVYLLLLSIILGGILPKEVYAENFDKEMEKAILKVKTLFNISDDYDGFNSGVDSYDKKISFYFNWTDSSEKLANISVSTDSEGNIISYNKYDSRPEEPNSKLPKYSREEALTIALDFIKKVDSKLSTEIKLEDENNSINIWEREYNFRFTRITNNISFKDNSVNISVNKFNGEINNYYTNWDRDLIFPKPDNIISLEKAKLAYKNEIGLKLVYKTSYRYPRPMDSAEKDNKYYLTYSPLDGGRKGIDAFTGKVMNIAYHGPIFGRGEDEKEMVNDSAAAIITPEERSEIEKLSGIKDAVEIEKKAREFLKLDNEYKLESKNLYSDWNNLGEYQWSLYFTKGADDKKLPVNVTMDAKTAEIVNFNIYDNYNPNDKVQINKAQALQIAKDYLSKTVPNISNQLEYIEDEEGKDEQQSYYFRFIRKANDIYVESDGIYVGVNAVNKEINSYNLVWYKGELPPKGDIISLDKAYEILFNKIGFELAYVTIYNYEKTSGDNREIKLSYLVNTNKSVIIDAKSGDILDNSGKPIKDSKKYLYTDIDTSYAKDKIKTLSQYGVGFTTERFLPKEKIKQKDFLFLLWKSMNSYRTETESDMDIIYKDLIRSNILKSNEENREIILTKEEAVKFVIRAMQYEKIAEIKNIYADIFKDGEEIDSNLKGHMSLAYGLKIITGDGSGLIKPKYELKREDAVSIIYSYIFN